MIGADGLNWASQLLRQAKRENRRRRRLQVRALLHGKQVEARGAFIYQPEEVLPTMPRAATPGRVLRLQAASGFHITTRAPSIANRPTKQATRSKDFKRLLRAFSELRSSSFTGTSCKNCSLTLRRRLCRQLNPQPSHHRQRRLQRRLSK